MSRFLFGPQLTDFGGFIHVSLDFQAFWEPTFLASQEVDWTGPDSQNGRKSSLYSSLNQANQAQYLLVIFSCFAL